MVDTRVPVARLMVDDDVSGAVTADLTINLSSQYAGALSRPLKSVIVHPYLLASSNGSSALTQLTSDSPICPTCLFQSNDMTSSRL
ncbi:hypothetical protein TNCV_3042811 [Trichonephila clavipes]|nr:hypothetical protein TNCV_3042811 [Trichonephila clavipes]